MIISEKKLENARMELQFEVPEDIVENEYEKVFKEFQKNARIDGFRKGKVPLDIIKKRFQDSADAEAAENIVKAAYIDAIKEKDLNPVSQPEIDFTGKIERSKPLKFTIRFDVSPTIELGEYKNLSVKENDCKIADSDIEDEIQSLREKHATVSKKAEGERAEKGNYVRAQVKRADSAEKGESDDTVRNISMIAGKDKTDYSFDDDVIGMKVNEEKEVTKKYPKDYADKELAGQKVKYLLKVIEISTLTLPELDNEFAKDLGEFSSIDDVRKKIREDFESYVKGTARRLVNTELMNKIIENSKFDLPESMIASEMKNYQSRIARNMGIAEDKLEELFSHGALNKDEFLARTRDESIKNIKSTLVLIEVAKRETIKAPEDKYNEVIDSYVKNSGKSREEIENIIEKNGSRENIETDLVLTESADFIYNNANIKKQKPVSFEEFKKL